MRIVYCLSILMLLFSFLLVKKNRNKLNIIHSVIFSICLLLCYQAVVVFLVGFIGSLVYYSVINCVVSIIIFFVSYKRKEIQKYYFNKREFVLFFVILLSSFLVVWIKFRGFDVINYLSDDSSIHYRAALGFSKNLVIYDKNNSFDLIYDFRRMMPFNYINAGFFIKIFNFLPSYKVYLLFDSFCYMLYSLLFLVIIVREFDKKNYFYYYVVTMLYVLGFPFNNLLFGFGYLGLGVMVVELVYYFIKFVGNVLDDNVLFNNIILFILCLSLFLSYYLFVPFLYLSLFIYYVIMFKKGKFSFRVLLLYIIFSLIIPFSVGFVYFVLPGFFTSGNVIFAISNWGLIYDNKTPMYVFILFVYAC